MLRPCFRRNRSADTWAYFKFVLNGQAETVPQAAITSQLALMRIGFAQAIAALFVLDEIFWDIGMAQRFVAVVGKQVLL